MTGLVGTGKTTLSKKLADYLEYSLISQNGILREFGMKKMPRTKDEVLRESDKRLAYALNQGCGAILDSVNKYSQRRQQVYGIASCCGVDAITLECICSEEESKKRMKRRPPSDGLISDPNNPRIYYKILKEGQNIEEDFKYNLADHVSHLRYDSKKNIFEISKIAKNSRNLKNLKKFIKKIKAISTSNC